MLGGRLGASHQLGHHTGLSHFPMWDQPDAFAQAVIAFLDALP